MEYGGLKQKQMCLRLTDTNEAHIKQCIALHLAIVQTSLTVKGYILMKCNCLPIYLTIYQCFVRLEIHLRLLLSYTREK